MNTEQMIKKIKELEEKYCTLNGYGDYFVGVRFEDKEREIGEEVGNSRHNLDREDEREMPEYGTTEYKEMFELDGASAYDIDYIIESLENGDEFFGNHCYFIIGTNYTNEDDALDYGEVVVVDAKVLYQFY